VGLGYVPAAPYAFVNTGELFTPRVGTRVVAGPQIGVVAAHTRPYVPAAPAVGGAGRVAAHPSVGGPRPSDLRIAPQDVARVEVGNRGIVQARAFAHPATATPLGARAPVGSGYRAPFAQAEGRPAPAYRAVPSYAPAYGARAPSSPSHFGGRRLGAGFTGNVASTPPMPSPVRGGDEPAYFGAPPASEGHEIAPPLAYRSAAAPGFRGAPGMAPAARAPAFEGTPQEGPRAAEPAESNAVHGPPSAFQGEVPAAGFHGAVPPATFRSPAASPAFTPAPAIHPVGPTPSATMAPAAAGHPVGGGGSFQAPSAGVFRGGSGFHGGGGGHAAGHR
jgi:hypothetical protein